MDDELVLWHGDQFCWMEVDLGPWVKGSSWCAGMLALPAPHAERGVQCATLVNIEPLE